MIIATLFHYFVTVWNYLIGFLPSADATIGGFSIGHFPEIVFTSAEKLGEYLMVLDPVFPIDVLYTVITWQIILTITVAIIRSTIWGMVYGYLIRRIFSLF